MALSKVIPCSAGRLPEETCVFEAVVINPKVRQQAGRYRQQFDSAQPFRHVVIDYFFEPDSARRVLADFPPFDPENARNEFGGVGRKAVVQDIARISPFYAQVFDYLGSEDFLGLISRITGISGLIHDERMFGGGTHENLEGQELDPHVDFNYLEDRKLHRRLNVLLYLNTEWEVDWGGCLELHSDPRHPRTNQIKVIQPWFNRCVVFETSEYSWHGFEKIHLPEDKKHLSRKLLSIYLYTRDRPAEEIVPPHATFYVQRPMPARMAAGYTLQEEDVRQIEELFQRRDDWIEHYQKKELRDSGRIQQYIGHIQQVSQKLTGMNDRIKQVKFDFNPLHWPENFLARRERARRHQGARPPSESSRAASESAAASESSSGSWVAPAVATSEPLVPLAGYATQEAVEGMWEDGWTGNPFVYCARLHQPILGLEIDGYLAAPHPELNLRLIAGGRTTTARVEPVGFFSIRAYCDVPAGEQLRLRIESDATYSPARAGLSADGRELMIHLREIRLLHPPPETA
jgi:2OG-Fe(II) oxygenase superfamily